MRAMLEKYNRNFSSLSTYTRGPGTIPWTPTEVVLVTGTTGSLGCHLLETLYSCCEVDRVYAFNRSAKHGACLYDRQKVALVERGIDSHILDTGKIVLVEGDLTKPLFGLSDQAFNEIHQSVTHIIHNAWPVDFVSSLQAFEPTVQGVRYLVDFALMSPWPSPRRLLFTSSTATVQYSPCGVTIPELPLGPDITIHNGYSEAKWVCEHILYAAAAETPMDPLVVRVGQLSGGRMGTWHASEWFPVMVQSAAQLNCFPDDKGLVDWLPFDIAAAAVVDLRNASSTTHTLHLVHPRPISWHTIAIAMSSEFSVPLVAFSEWLTILEQAAQATTTLKAKSRDFRAPKLIPFYRSLEERSSSSRMSVGFPEVDITQALKLSSTLADPNLRQISAMDIRRWLEYWYSVGLLSGNSVHSRL